MSSRRLTTFIFAGLVAIGLAGQAVMVRQLDQLRPAATLEEILYVRSPATLKRLSLGYTGLVADIYWTRAVQYFGKKHLRRARDYDLLFPLLDLTTSLDPKMIAAYEFGATFLAQQPPEGAGQAQKAIELLEKGIAHNPQNWRLYYDRGFVQYLELRDYRAAARSFEKAADQPGAPVLRPLAARMAQEGGEPATARALWEFTYTHSEDRTIKENARKHLVALEVDQVVEILEQRVELYRRRTGRLPASWRDLIAAGLLRGIPRDPLGRPFRLRADGRVLVENPDDVPFITRGLPNAPRPSIDRGPVVQ